VACFAECGSKICGDDLVAEMLVMEQVFLRVVGEGKGGSCGRISKSSAKQCSGQVNEERFDSKRTGKGVADIGVNSVA
jgi:hypothetical protein